MILHWIRAVKNLRASDEVEIDFAKGFAPVPVAILMPGVALIAAQCVDEAVAVKLPGTNADGSSVDGFDLEDAAAGGELLGGEGRKVEARRQRDEREIVRQRKGDLRCVFGGQAGAGGDAVILLEGEVSTQLDAAAPGECGEVRRRGRDRNPFRHVGAAQFREQGL